MEISVYLGLGSSLGERETHLRQALAWLVNANVSIVRVSSVYESPHLGLKPEDAANYPAHLNLVAELETSLSASELLAHLRNVETAGQRQRNETWGPRTIDIDILLYGDNVIQTAELTVPHPGLTKRAFVVLPLAELAPDLTLPDGTPIADIQAKPEIQNQTISRRTDINLNAPQKG